MNSNISQILVLKFYYVYKSSLLKFEGREDLCVYSPINLINVLSSPQDKSQLLLF